MQGWRRDPQVIGDVPFVNSGQFIFVLLISPLQVVSVVELTASRTPTLESPGDVLPVHAISLELD